MISSSGAHLITPGDTTSNVVLAPNQTAQILAEAYNKHMLCTQVHP